MNVGLRLAGFATVLVLVFGAAALAGSTVGPDRSGESRAEAGESDVGGHMGEGETGGHSGDGAAPAPVRGLAVSDGGLTLALEDAVFERGRRGELRFSIRGAGGTPVRDFEVEHEKRMHLIVVRRDGRGFQHLHPTLGPDGTWSVPLTLPDAGAYRVFADFKHDGEARTLAADLTVDGAARYLPLPEPTISAAAGDGYEVRLSASRVRAGREVALEFSVTRDGHAVESEPYLGARGHLVALREGDLAFLHVHPDEDSLAFMAEFPSAGRYRLYLQFKHDGRVHTAEFTQEVSR
jgi:hypothetical protein